ncbi:MAG: hypothetical protein KJO18_10515 [Acidimicrobiia bacterium]|nr:hypothetical protein [Acidimicrobiia bacterium]
MKPSAEQSRYIETVGRFWESVSGSRTAGRLLGWLMICEPVHQSAADLISTLDVSAGSVSTQMRVLERLDLVERVTFPGDRARYYQLQPDAWMRAMHNEQERLIAMRKVAEAGQAVLPNSRPERVLGLAETTSLLIDEWPALMERIAERAKQGRQ